MRLGNFKTRLAFRTEAVCCVPPPTSQQPSSPGPLENEMGTKKTKILDAAREALVFLRHAPIPETFADRGFDLEKRLEEAISEEETKKDCEKQNLLTACKRLLEASGPDYPPAMRFAKEVVKKAEGQTP